VNCTYTLTIDDAGSGGPERVESVRKTCRFLESRGLRATWFVVPKPGGQPWSDDWKRAFLEGRDAGHDLQLHGLTHSDCFEFGPPVAPATRILPSFLEQFEARRAELLPNYTLGWMRAVLEIGLEEFDRELSLTPTVFRPPCGSICKALFQALSELGIRYDTGQYLNMGCYDHLGPLGGKPNQTWTDNWPRAPFRWYSEVVEVPIVGEYTWRGASAYEPAFIEMAKADVDRIAESSSVGVLLAHTHGIADNYDYAFRLFDAVLEHLEGQGRRRFATLAELAAAGALEPLPETAPGPDLLEV